MKLIQKIIKALRGYRQEELIELKAYITDHIDSIKNNMATLGANKEFGQFKELVVVLENSREDLAKVKNAIALNNVRYGINKLIYQRERLQKLLYDLKRFEKAEYMNTGVNAKDAKKDLNFKQRIAGLEYKLKEIDKKRTNKNKRAITFGLKLKTKYRN